jgi:site-specific recombinase XerD
MKPTDFAAELSHFLGSYLPSQRNASPNTIKAYRDAFTLLIRYCEKNAGISPERLTLEHLDVPLLLTFLQGLEDEHDCGVATRNNRLAAIHSFFRSFQSRCPERILLCQLILAIPRKRQAQSVVRYLSVDEIKALLAQPGLQTRNGLRDTALLAVLYDTGARVQEVADLNPGAIRMGTTSQVELTGKGRKRRVVPLIAQTARLLADYLAIFRLSENREQPLFFNHTKTRLTRGGIRHILEKYAEAAGKTTQNFPGKVNPHMLRHSKAMHLLHAGTPMPIIQAVLGHADIRTH